MAQTPPYNLRVERTSFASADEPKGPTRALSVRQPYAELILRGEKKVEYRSRPTRIRERVYVYASKRPGEAEDFDEAHLRPEDLPTGVLAGTVEVVGCTGEPLVYEWRLANPERLPEPLKPKRHPQPVWFHPF